MRLIVVLAFALFGATCLSAEEVSEQTELQVTKKVTMRYLVDTPEGFDKAGDQKYPLILFLHGAGERGDDLSRVKVHGPHKYVKENKLPVIVVSPQCDARSWWEPEALLGLVDHLENTYPIDRSRIYVTGLSMGGFGTWSMINEAPDRFAAVVPICGGGEPKNVTEALKDLPIWVFHGGQDNVVPPERSQDMVDALKAVGNEVKYTVYPDAGHDSWTETYNDPALYEWLLNQKRQ